ncbi:hypothetical protein RJ639_000419 [Escallonia herrerae]|uniref:Uncharacterized protein n=1 Tax=Escallonia herrerae TaxID=1293975 RepID=A0AA88X7P9_9ASTE|nr:hypothetical protein RJ639_000419 [Escallonia herrerae]
MATAATTMWSVLVLLIAFTAGCCLSSPALPISDISAAPAILPNAPLSSPAPTLSPDITPLFPSPSGSGLSPSESSLPIIPSSPSPPNPDDMFAPGPTMVIAPSGSLPFSSSNVVPGSLSTSVMVAFCCSLAFWLMIINLGLPRFLRAIGLRAAVIGFFCGAH